MHPNCKKNNIIKPGNCSTGPCFHADQIIKGDIEECTDPETYDFFSNSSASFIFTFLGITTFFCGKFFIIVITFIIISAL